MAPEVELSSALFQAAVYLETYPVGTFERQIADICAQASAVMEPEEEQPA